VLTGAKGTLSTLGGSRCPCPFTYNGHIAYQVLVAISVDLAHSSCKNGVRPTLLTDLFVMMVPRPGVKYHHLNFSIVDFKRTAILNNKP
jgi:hypothetical protein